MKGNYQNMETFLKEVQRREGMKEDYFVPTDKALMVEDKTLALESIGGFGITNLAHTQIASRLNIPKKYYDKMRNEVPGLLSHNVNTWFKTDRDKRLVRTMDGDVRAYLSDRYKRMDNFELLYSLIPTLKEHKDTLVVRSQSLTESRMYLQFEFPRLKTEVSVGDIVTAGLIVTNSEVGLGALDIREMVWRLSCSNGMITGSIKRQHHLGASIGYEEFYTEQTINAKRKALMLELKDVFRNAITQESLLLIADKMRKAMDQEVKSKPTDFIKKVTKKFSLSETEGEDILVNMMREGNMNKFGLANGVTYLAHSTENRDRQFDLENLGGDIIKLSPSQWEMVA